MFRFLPAVLAGMVVCSFAAEAPSPAGSRLRPNLIENIERPLRYRPDGADFVIENGTEFFNRPLYGGNTAFRVDGGDKPEFVLYLPGRGGNLRLGLTRAGTARWLHETASITTRYRPGTLRYEVRDPILGEGGRLELVAIALPQTDGLVLRVEAHGVTPGLELAWAYGGVNGQRGRRDGDIGTENVPIGEWFQLKREFCADNTIELRNGGFSLRARAATLMGVTSADSTLRVSDAAQWADLAGLLNTSYLRAPTHPVVVGRTPLAVGKPVLLSLQRVAAEATASPELDTYRAVTAPQPASDSRPAAVPLLASFRPDELGKILAEAERHFAALRARVSTETPDPFLDAAVGALNVAADAVWDQPQQAIMHGAVAWRSRLLGWRGPYVLDALGWHERARQHFRYWAGRQNQQPIPAQLPPADENANLARNEAGLHSNGDMSNSHYDMNLVYLDALFRHLAWTGDLELARELWPTIQRHLAWEQRLFRREFGPNKLPLYEAYAAIWASDDLQYHGGGTMHASAYNYFHNQQAARLARLLREDPTPYQREAQLLERGMREHLWVPGGWFAEYKDLLGLQRVHPSAALWTFYHAMDSEVATAHEAWQMTRQVEAHIPQLPVRGPGVPAGLYTLASSNWLPYRWSINNVVMAEAVHAALGFWQTGRADEAWSIAKGSVVAAMFMGISPGNVGSMSYLDVYRRESQRDFADGSGVLSRAIVEGLFGVRPDLLAGELAVTPGWPADWERALVRHPDFEVGFGRNGLLDTYRITQRLGEPQSLRLRLVGRHERIAAVTVNGRPANWHPLESSVGRPRIEILASPEARYEVTVQWAGAPVAARAGARDLTRVQQGMMRWWHAEPTVNKWPATPGADAARGLKITAASTAWEPVDLGSVFNDRVTQIFRNEYRSPRSPFVSLAIPKQGIGGWAGGVNAAAEIDDAGLRAELAKGGGRIELPGGVPLVTPAERDARNIVFTSQWDNYPRDATVPLRGRAREVVLLMAGSTNHMQSRIENGEVVVAYADGSSERLPLVNPSNWWPIEQDYFVDDYQFRRPEPLPIRVDLKTGRVRVLDPATFKGTGGTVRGGAATVLSLPLDPARELKSLTVRTLSNEVVIGLMAATLAR